MPQYRMTMFFHFAGSPPAGFTESWEYTATDDQEAANQALSVPKERASILSHDWEIQRLRVARLSLVQAPDCKIIAREIQIPICLAPQKGLIDSDADTPWAALLVDITTRQSTPSVGSTPRPRRWQVRGIPDDWWTGVLSVPQEAKDALSRWCRFITGQGGGGFGGAIAMGKVKPNAGCTAINLQPYTSCCIRRISNRRIGRPFGLLVGRRRAPASSSPEP